MEGSDEFFPRERNAFRSGPSYFRIKERLRIPPKGVPVSDKVLSGRKIAILATDGFEESEFAEPKKALEEAGAEVLVVSLKSGSIKSWSKGNWGKSYEVDLALEDTDADEFDALILPGGAMNPDKLRTDKNAISFIRDFADGGKPIAAICHAPWLLIEADLVEGKTVTSWKSVHTDLVNAGAHWVDRETVEDDGILTSRQPADIPAFNRQMIEMFARKKPVQSIAPSKSAKNRERETRP